MFTNGKTGNSGGTYVGEDLNRRSEALGASCHFVDMSSALMRSVSPKLVFSLCFKPSYVRRRVWDRLSLCCSDGPFRCAASASSLMLTHTRTRISIARDDARLLTHASRLASMATARLRNQLAREHVQERRPHHQPLLEKRTLT